MKNCFFYYFWIIVIILITSCGSSPSLIENKNGYSRHLPKVNNEELLNKRPEWFYNFEDWRKQQEENGIHLFFLGTSTPPTKFEKDHTLEIATAQARIMAVMQITDLIDLQIKSSYEERIREAREQSGVGQGRETVEELIRYRAEEEAYLEFESKSEVLIEGLRPIGSFYELYELRKKERVIIGYKVWFVYSVSKNEIEIARQRISSEREAMQDLQRRQASREAREEIVFKNLSNQYDIIKSKLNDIEISHEEKKIIFIDLIDLYVRLEGLSTQKDKPQYVPLTEDIRVAIRDFDPVNYVRYLELQLADREARLSELRRGNVDERIMELNQIIASGQGYTLQTHTYIFSFPQKPQEIQVSSVNILAANDMVTNRDFISFSNIIGSNYLSRADNGLDVPVTSVTWNDAARYCNWLSRLYGLEPCYREAGGRITGYERTRNGYRLPEHEEIIVMLLAEHEIINENEFSENGIWSSSGFPQGYTAYRLSAGTGSAAERLMKQTFNSGASDREIGFRVVRNAK
jgi:hypothetical protein